MEVSQGNMNAGLWQEIRAMKKGDIMNTNIAFAVREVSEKVEWVLKDLRKLFHLLKSCIIVNRKPSANGWLSR